MDTAETATLLNATLNDIFTSRQLPVFVNAGLNMQQSILL